MPRKPAKTKPVPPAPALTGLRAALYSRVSTAGQVEGTSLDTQEDSCRLYAKRHGWRVVENYVDAGLSGAREDRPALMAMQAAAESGEIDVVIVYRLDRLGRSTSHTHRIVERLGELNVRFVSCVEDFDTTTPTGRLMFSILVSLATLERETIRSRSMEGVRRRVEQGGFVSSSPPYGYRSVPDPRPGMRGQVLEIDPDQAECVRSMYKNLVEDRRPMGEAVSALNAAGYTSAAGVPWTASSLSTWSRRHQPLTAAAGKWAWNDLQVEIPPILDSVEVRAWEQWQNATTLPQTSHGGYLLSGFLYTPCGDGQRRYHGRTVREQTPTYSCRHALSVRKSDPTHCGCRNIRVDSADMAVWTRVVELLRSPSVMESLAAEVAGEKGATDFVTMLKDAAESAANIESRLVAEYHLLREKGHSFDMASRMIKPIQSELYAAEELVRKLNWQAAAAQRGSVGRDVLAATMDAVGGHLDALDDDGKRAVMMALGVKARVTRYAACTRCHGTGYIALAVPGRRRWPDVCPRCLRMRWVPVIEIHLEAPDAFFLIPHGTIK